ncbi:MAG: imidazole glycerol phosphate synthase subunit HisH [Planctomycetota bacterium]|jgi:glutamine amidotransferase
MSARIAVVDYEMGNLRSVSSALARLGAEAVITVDPAVLSSSDGIVLPGVGAFGDAARALAERGLVPGLRAAAEAAAEGEGAPFLGVCLGLQLLFAGSEEAPDAEGLDVLPGSVKRFPAKDADGRVFKVPHVGWNSVAVEAENELTGTVAGGEYFYFVHSYYAETGRAEDTALSCDYAGVRFAAMAARGRLFASQFHPEKSQAAGLAMLRTFVEMCS